MSFKNWVDKTNNNDSLNSLIKLLDEKEIVRVSGLFGSANALVASGLFKNADRAVLFVCKDETEARNILLDLKTFGIDKSYYFPSIETTPYESAIVEESICSERLEVLKALINNEKCIVVLSVETLIFHVTPKSILTDYMIELNKGNTIAIDELSKKLTQGGYSRTSKVNQAGEFAVRGDIVDIYYSIHKNPVRLDFFDEEIESIKTFNLADQRSEEILDTVVIPPHKEIVFSEKEIDRAKKVLKNLEGDAEEKSRMLEEIDDFKSFDGEQYYLNLFYDKASILEYFEDPLLIINDYSLIKKSESSLIKEFNEGYNLFAHKKKPRVKPEDMLFSLEEIVESASNVIEYNFLDNQKNPPDINFDYKGIPVYLGNLDLFKEDLDEFLKNGYRVVLFANTKVQAERLLGIFKDFDPQDDKFDFRDSGFSILPLSISDGFTSESNKIFFLNDSQIFGVRKKISKHYYSKRTEAIDSFIDLKPGDYVVHINHGIGQFLGIERVKSFGLEKDYISILYSDDDKIFIPVEQLNFIQKYISSEFAKPKLDKIGAKGWSRTKERVQHSIEELAKELIKLYSARLKQKGFSFQPDTPWQKEFEAKFPFEETEDQLLTLEEVKRDMESAKPMDRLICGDVGFGKTEIAIRAAFKAAVSGKQVAILVPTTILAEQHFENFAERLKDYPIRVDMLSRFRSQKEQTEIIEKLKTGDVDIIIGTHRLLSNDITFKNPGLFIIDEEQRFGVKHKEKLKQVKKNLDCLSLTATPIPRTLHMSLSNIRNISIINTPPKERQSVETYVTEFNEEILIDAIKREMERGGQIFFLYNRIKTIYTIKQYLQKLIPKARIVVAHGRLKEEELEDIIHSFIHYEYDILLTTTIIESGIDMPRVNTIFIDRADRFGLSQLYQLRGRVGRSEKKAYAYLFYAKDQTLTEDAMKRLRVISEYTELGSGFKVAMKDLEIRGAGNLLGPEQHGDILAVGFQLYCKLLSEAVSKLAPEDSEELKTGSDEVYLELKYSGFIPDSYILDQKQKMEFYKKIAGIVHEEEIEDIKKSLEDRFGDIPQEVFPLFYLAEIKILCKKLKVNEIVENKDTIEIKFSNVSDISLDKLMHMIATSKGNVLIKGQSPNSIFIKLKSNDDDDVVPLEEKGELLKDVLSRIS